MNDKNAVIAKIISDAEAAAGERERIASEKAEALVSSARKAAAAYMQKMLAGGDERVEQILSRSRSVDALDTRRELSACKSRLTDEAFSAAAQELKKDKKAYKAFLTRCISANAEDGDEVVICAEDEKVITHAFVAGIAKSAKIKLKLSSKRGSFAGGVILSGKKYDKNLTLEEELRLVRQECEAEVTAALFKGE